MAEPLRGLPPDRHMCLPAVFVADVFITQAADGAGGLLDAAIDQACWCGLRRRATEGGRFPGRDQHRPCARADHTSIVLGLSRQGPASLSSSTHHVVAAAAAAAPGRVTLACQAHRPAQRRELKQGCTSQEQRNAQGVRPCWAPRPEGRKRPGAPKLMLCVLLQQVLLLRGLLLLLVQVQLKVIWLPYLQVAPEAALAVRLKGTRLWRYAGGIGAVGHLALLIGNSEECLRHEVDDDTSLPCSYPTKVTCVYEW